MTALEVFAGSDGEITKAYYKDLEKLGARGLVALNIFRAQKCSTRAKKYRGGVSGKGSYRGMAYDRKNWSMGLLAEMLEKCGGELGITWGWKRDPEARYNDWVLYIDLPGQGQVSFHSPTRLAGPDYLKDWDREHRSEERILAFCDSVMNAPDPRQEALQF